jgi:hypothetical protein
VNHLSSFVFLLLLPTASEYGQSFGNFALGPGTEIDHFPDTKKMVLRVKPRIFTGCYLQVHIIIAPEGFNSYRMNGYLL